MRQQFGIEQRAMFHAVATVDSIAGAKCVEAVLRAGRTPCIDQVLAFKDPKGTEIELFNSPRFAEAGAVDPLRYRP